MGFLIFIIIVGIISLIGSLAFIISNKDSLVKPVNISIGGLIFIAPVGLFLLVNSVMVTDTGHVKVLSTFGEVHKETYPEGGPYFVNPFAKSTSYNVRRKEVQYEPYEKGDNSTLAVSQDDVPIRVQATFPYALNSSMAWKVHREISNSQNGGIKELVNKSAWSTVRTVMADYKWQEAVNEKQQKFAQDLTKEFRKKVTSDLVANGFTKEQAERTFKFMPVKLRRILPPERILTEINKEKAAKRALKREEHLFEKAKKEAKRRSKEGEGIKNMLNKLPEKHSAADIARILSANAKVTKANAINQAVESGKVEVMVLGGSNQPSVSVK